MRQVQRCKSGIDRGRDDRIGKRNFRILQTGPFLAEKHAAFETGVLVREDGCRRPVWRKHRLRQETASRGGCGEIIQVRDGIRNGTKKGGPIDDLDGKRSRSPRSFVRPTVARLHEPQFPQPEIRHGPSRSADVFAELRLDENDCWSRKTWARIDIPSGKRSSPFVVKQWKV